jgi:hypothetical protein
MLSQDQLDRECGIEVVYIRSAKFGKKVRCTWWFKDKDPRNKARMLPGKVQTVNCGLLFALREVLKAVRKEMAMLDHTERVPILFVKTDATYIQEGVDTHMYKWRNNEWRNSRYKVIKNHLFWQSVNYELTKLEELDIGVRVQHKKLPKKCIRF